MSNEEKLELPHLSGIPAHERVLMEKYFSRVANRNGWKKPINTSIKLVPEEIPLLKKSIECFTNSKHIEITEENPGEYRVIAEGYYNAIGDV